MSEPLSVDVRAAIDRLKRLGNERPELAGFVRLYQELLPLIFDGLPATQHIAASQDWSERFVAGEPLFRKGPPRLDDGPLHARFDRVIAVLSKHRDPDGPQWLAQSMCDSCGRISNTLVGIFAGGSARFAEFLTSHGLDVSLGMNVLRLSALPVLAEVVRELEAKRTWVGWSRGNCPACGSWPLLAEFRGLEQFRWLRCGLCSAGWQVDRLYCPFCETRDHRLLQDWSAEGEQQRYRVTTCEACRGFVRGISTLGPISVPGLLVAELEILHLELVAHERGFKIDDK